MERAIRGKFRLAPALLAAVLLSLAAAGACLPAGRAARAAEGRIIRLSDGTAIFEMADGAYFYPTSGQRASSPEELVARLPVGVATSTAETLSTDATGTPPDGGQAPATPGRSLKDAILRGREMLAEKIAAEKAKNPKSKTVSSQNVWVDVTLAVWNSETDEIKLVDAKKKGTGLQMEDDGLGLDVSVRLANGVNSEYVIDDTGENYVVAIQYPIFKEKYLTKNKKVYTLNDVLYTPYSRQIHTAEIVAWGKQVLDDQVAAVYGELRAQGVKSLAFRDRLLADVIDPEIVKGLDVVEHVSPQGLLGDNGTRVAESVYVVLATNQNSAYAYSKSTAGARGIAQFIPSTYKLVARRKDLGLIQDFDAAVADQRNMIKAQIAYLDAELSDMPAAVRDLMQVDPERVGEYLAAAYNGGGARVRKAIAFWGDAWSENHTGDFNSLHAEHLQLDSKMAGLKSQIRKADAKTAKKLKNDLYLAQKKHDALIDRGEAMKKANLRAETVDYVKKFRKMMAMLKPPLPTQLASAGAPPADPVVPS